jgi:hypothetical protein
LTEQNYDVGATLLLSNGFISEVVSQGDSGDVLVTEHFTPDIPRTSAAIIWKLCAKNTFS